MKRDRESKRTLDECKDRILSDKCNEVNQNKEIGAYRDQLLQDHREFLALENSLCKNKFISLNKAGTSALTRYFIEKYEKTNDVSKNDIDKKLWNNFNRFMNTTSTCSTIKDEFCLCDDDANEITSLYTSANLLIESLPSKVNPNSDREFPSLNRILFLKKSLI